MFDNLIFICDVIGYRELAAMALDNFNRASETFADNFNRSNGGLGSNWTTWKQDSTTAPTITSDQVVGNTATTYQEAFYSGATFNSDSQFAQAVVPVGGNNANGAVSVLVNCAGTAAGSYQGYRGQFFNGNFRIDKVSGGTASIGSNIVGTVHGGDVIRLESIQLNGTTVISLYQNGLLIDYRTDFSSPLIGGSPGLGVYGNTSVSILSNWIGGVLPDGDLGTSWVVLTGSVGIHSQSVTAGVSSTSVDCYAIWGANLFPEDQSSQATLPSLGSGKAGVIVRFCGLNVQGNSGSLASGYSGVASSGAWAINKVAVNDSVTALKTGSTTWNTNDVILLTVKGTTLSLYQNGTLLGSVTDSSYLAGHAGIYVRGNASIKNWFGSPVLLTTTVASDDFNRAAGALGSNWKNFYGRGGAIISMGNVGNGSTVSGSPTEANDDAPLWVGAGTFNVDCWAQIVVSADTPPSQSGGAKRIGIGVVLRQVDDFTTPDDSSTGYTTVSNYGISPTPSIGSSPHVLAWYEEDSVFTTLAFKGGLPFQTNDVIFQAAVGDCISSYINGILDLQARDKESPGAGQPGFNCYDPYNYGSANILMTAFLAGNFTTSPS